MKKKDEEQKLGRVDNILVGSKVNSAQSEVR